MNKAHNFRHRMRGQLYSLGRAKAARLLATVVLAGAALLIAGCAGDYYETGYSTGYYAPDYGPYYGEYGYGGVPYLGYGGYFGGPDIIIGTSHYHHYYGGHHFAAEHRSFAHRAPSGRGQSPRGGVQRTPPRRSH